MSYQKAKRALHALADPEHAAHHQRFFRTGPGEYGEGDVFLGLRVPQVRQIAKEHRELGLDAIGRLLRSAIHEERLLALVILVDQYQRAPEDRRTTLVDFYLEHLDSVDNWDLVDLSAPKILGKHLLTRPRKLLDRLSRSKNLWERRIAMLATLTFIQAGEWKDTLRLAERYLNDSEDLIHKASGWMLREVGKADEGVLLAFLDQHYPNMPRTMLRYALEKVPERIRQQYLKGRR
ncbi:MAG TPA: DNA alkylation repair protein [Planctomycetota bacterium]|nr:DNA alkylation repair protein [Planctomycetota bacterium]